MGRRGVSAPFRRRRARPPGRTRRPRAPRRRRRRRGGATRADSVRAGIAAVPDDAEVIVVHDAARPLASPALFDAVIAAVTDGGADGAVPGLPLSDTIKAVDDSGHVTRTLDRSALVAVQTPQAFRAGILRRAHERRGAAAAAHRRRGARRGARRHGAGRARRTRQPQDHGPGRPERGRAAPRTARRRPERAHRPGDRHPPLLRGPPPPTGARRRRDRGRAGWAATATPTRCATRWPTPYWAPSAWAISAGTFPTPTRSGRGRTAWPC